MNFKCDMCLRASENCTCSSEARIKDLEMSVKALTLQLQYREIEVKKLELELAQSSLQQARAEADKLSFHRVLCHKDEQLRKVKEQLNECRANQTDS